MYTYPATTSIVIDSQMLAIRSACCNLVQSM